MKKKLKDQNQKLTYINNRLDFYVKNKQYDKAKDALKTFYEKNKNDESVEIFYNNKNKELEESLKEKV
jgi:hypothetical protein